jgi:hypothetical protein
MSAVHSWRWRSSHVPSLEALNRLVVVEMEYLIVSSV